MPFYSSSVWRYDGNTERYAGTYDSPEEAGQAALDKYDAWISGKLAKMKPGTAEHRLWDKLRVPRFVEVNDTNGRLVGSFKAKKV